VSRVVVTGLRVALSRSEADVVTDVTFSIGAGEIVGLVGESGSGKTTVATAMLGHTRKGAKVVEGSVVVDGIDILSLSPGELRSARGRVISYVPQDPAAALDPCMSIGRHLREAVEAHESKSGIDWDERLGELLRDAGLDDVDGLLDRYPHELSGGQRQRVCIAMAFACKPACVVLDEPTTGLDVTTQAHILASVRRLAREHDVAMLYVTHDLAVVEDLADRMIVMYAGRIVEQGPVQTVFHRSAHPYSRALMATTPDVRTRLELQPIPGMAPRVGSRPPGCAFADRCPEVANRCREDLPPHVHVGPGHEAACWFATDVTAERSPLSVRPEPTLPTGSPILEAEEIRASYHGREVVHSISLSINRGECLALVGESGSGKTTLSRSLIGLSAQVTGRLRLSGEELSLSLHGRTLQQRHALQYVFQSPRSSLNPRRTVFESIEAPLRGAPKSSAAERRARVFDALRRVDLDPSFGPRFPDQLSGGERQRVGIARALVCNPEVLICDEITSALDVSVQAAIIDLLEGLQRDQGLALLFVTHNLALVRTIADRVIVLRAGHVVEEGSAADTLQHPRHEYTQTLIRDTPSILSAIASPGAAE
jgi:peptide/nickel transport system ATP-binding protein